jgi:hypothetical protein
MRKATLLQEAHLFGGSGGILGRRAEFAAPYLPSPLILVCQQIFLQPRQRCLIQAVAVQFRQDARTTESRRPPVNQRLRKTLFGQKFLRLQPVEQGLDVVALLRMPCELAR